jgi:hypothetical protein
MATRRVASGNQRFKCRQAGCPNTYTNVIGGDNAFGKNHSGADCVPCNIAAQMLDNGQTPEQIEACPQMMELMLQVLKGSGWTWQDVKDSLPRRPKTM